MRRRCFYAGHRDGGGVAGVEPRERIRGGVDASEWWWFPAQFRRPTKFGEHLFFELHAPVFDERPGRASLFFGKVLGNARHQFPRLRSSFPMICNIQDSRAGKARAG